MSIPTCLSQERHAALLPLVLRQDIQLKTHGQVIAALEHHRDETREELLEVLGEKKKEELPAVLAADEEADEKAPDVSGALAA